MTTYKAIDTPSADPAAVGVFEPLLDLATADLYDRIAFRLLEMPVQAGERDVDRRHELMEKAIHNPLALPPGAACVLPRARVPDKHKVRDAAHALQDTERRLAYEFFWFWRLVPGSSVMVRDLAQGIEGLVGARATDQSSNAICGRGENFLGRTLPVRVLPDTCFVSRGAHQSMVRHPYRFALSSTEANRVRIDAVCINTDRPIPKQRDRFDGVKQAPSDLTRFLYAAQDADPMVVRPSVWAVTDNYAQHDVPPRLLGHDWFGRRRPAVSVAQMTEARCLLQRLGIQIRL